mgnify:FL=1
MTAIPFLIIIASWCGDLTGVPALQVTYNNRMNNTIDLPDVCVAAFEEHLRPDLFKALCDPNRLSIVAYLATQNAAVKVGTLAELHGIDTSGVSRHLKILKEAGVVAAQKQGREVMYSLNSDKLVNALRGFADAVETGCNTK